MARRRLGEGRTPPPGRRRKQSTGPRSFRVPRRKAKAKPKAPPKPVGAPPGPRPLRPARLVCSWCGQLYQGKQSPSPLTPGYCSGACRQAAYRARLKAARPAADPPTPPAASDQERPAVEVDLGALLEEANRDRKADAAAADLDRARHDPEYRD